MKRIAVVIIAASMFLGACGKTEIIYIDRTPARNMTEQEHFERDYEIELGDQQCYDSGGWGQC